MAIEQAVRAAVRDLKQAAIRDGVSDAVGEQIAVLDLLTVGVNVEKVIEEIGEHENMLRVVFEDPDEADYLLTIITKLSGGEPLSEREQLILLLGVRFMFRRERTITSALTDIAAQAIAQASSPSCN